MAKYLLLKHYRGGPERTDYGTIPMSDWTPQEVSDHIAFMNQVADDFRERDEFAQSVFQEFGDRLQGDPDPLPRDPTPVDKDTTVAPGAPWIAPNPDVQDPEEELDDRNDLLDVYQNFGSGDE